MCDIITTIQDAIHQIEEDYHVKVICHRMRQPFVGILSCKQRL